MSLFESSLLFAKFSKLTVINLTKLGSEKAGSIDKNIVKKLISYCIVNILKVPIPRP